VLLLALNFSFMTNKMFDATIARETFVLMNHHVLFDCEQMRFNLPDVIRMTESKRTRCTGRLKRTEEMIIAQVYRNIGKGKVVSVLN
jgi:hypothetical protein